MTLIIIHDYVKFGGIGYKVLSYARFKSRIKDGTFSVNDYLAFRFNSVKPSNVRRAVETLVKHGHLKKLNNDRYQYLETGVLRKLDTSYKQSLWNNSAANGKKKIENEDDEDF